MTPEAKSIACAVGCGAWTFVCTHLFCKLVRRYAGPPTWHPMASLGVRLCWLAAWLALGLFGPLMLLGDVNDALQPSHTVTQIGLWLWGSGLLSALLLDLRLYDVGLGMRARNYGASEVAGGLAGGGLGVLLGLLVGAWFHGGSERVAEVFSGRSENPHARVHYVDSEILGGALGAGIGSGLGWALAAKRRRHV